MDLSTNDGKLEFLKVLKDKYEQRAKYIDPSEEQNIFSWKSQKLHFNVILTHTSSDNDIVQGIIFFAEPSTTGKDELTYLDLYKKTKNFEYDSLYDVKDNLKYLIKNNLIRTPTLVESSLMKELIARFNLKDSDISKYATNYINALSKCLPRFDDRQRSQLEAMFLLRNSVDHFNSGYSNKGLCDTLLQGIVDIYNGIYLQSV